MCGIVGYIGQRPAQEILMEGLRRLSYRGYDSAGVATIYGGEIQCTKRAGKLSVLKSALLTEGVKGTIGIGHTRWATHGEPNEVNAHPHFSYSGRIALVHNGIFENYAELKGDLLARSKGFTMRSETDTEVLAHLIERELLSGANSLERAVSAALSRVEGAYAVAVLSADHPDEVVVARLGSPLVIGIGEGETFFASDEMALVGHVGRVIHLEDYNIVTLSRRTPLQIHTMGGERVSNPVRTIALKLEDIERGDSDYFMLKEIQEQPESLRNVLRGRLGEDGSVTLGAFAEERVADAMRAAPMIHIVGCGTSYYSALAGKQLIESFARVPVEVSVASEWRYRNPIIQAGAVVIAVSQSGTTADTLACLELAKERGALRFGITNVVGSQLTRMDDAGIYLHAGPEIAVASTKAFTSQVVAFGLLALKLASLRGAGGEEHLHQFADALRSLPARVAETLKTRAQIMRLVVDLNLHKAKRIIVMGRGYATPLAFEGALKLKEIAYIDTYGDAAGELKHGPLALIERGTPVIAIAPLGPWQDKLLSNIAEVEARGGEVIALVSRGDRRVKNQVKYTIEIPPCMEELICVVAAPVLQLFAYEIGVKLGVDVDQPRNLAKSVTVE